jgi:hypothetical protein
MKEEKYNINTFIGGWYIPDKICDDIIAYFEKAKHRHELGKVGKKNGLTIDATHKESTDVCLSGRDSLFDEYNKYLQKCLDLYAKKYPEVYNQYQRYGSGQLKVITFKNIYQNKDLKYCIVKERVWLLVY